jgi:hypothetical protein
MSNTVNGLLTTYGLTAMVGIAANLVAKAQISINTATVAGFIGHPQAWSPYDDDSVPIPTEDQNTIKSVFKNMIALKQVSYTTVAPVVPRFDWSSGDVYSEYTQFVTPFVFDANGIQTNPFYVRNSYDQVFKCLDNNNGAPSTVEPAILPGATSVSGTLNLTDGYTWKYLTTIDKGLKKTFFDNQWMPLTFNIIPPNTGIINADSAGFGKIDAIKVSNPGDFYTDGTQTTSVVIVGDGALAEAYANVSGGQVANIIVTNPGLNYTFANVYVVGNQIGQTGATGEAVISPIGGTGYDPVSELGCNHLMFTFEFNNDEHLEIDSSLTGQIPLPTDISYRQVGIIVNPILNSLTAPSFVASTYNAADTILVSSGVGDFFVNPAEPVYQGSATAPTWYGIVTKQDTPNSIIQVINTYGLFNAGENIIGAYSGTQRVGLQYTPTIVNIGSGYLMYYENRSAVQRSATGNEQIRIVLKF